MPKVWMYGVFINRDTDRLIFSKVVEKDMPQKHYDNFGSKSNWKNFVRVDHIDVDNSFDGENRILFYHPDKIVVEAVAYGIEFSCMLDNGRKWDDLIFESKQKALDGDNFNQIDGVGL